MPFAEDPAHLSKSRLKSDLVAHNVALPSAASKKAVYVELHLKHIDQKNAADFSSDEEDRADDKKDAEMPVPSCLTDEDLKAMLRKHGVKPGPITASTRVLYERKLHKLLQSDRRERLNEADKAVLYSDSEEEKKQQEKDQDSGSEKQPDPSDQTQKESSQNHVFYPQCFLPSSRLRPCPPRNTESSSNWNSRNALKSSERSQSQCSQIISTSTADHHTGLGSTVLPRSKSTDDSSLSSQYFSITQMVEEMENSSSRSVTDNACEFNGTSVQENWAQSDRPPQEPVKDAFKDILPGSKTTPTGIYVTRRRPIKGAAQRPVQYSYPDSPVSPMTQQRREVERYLVPIHIQILVFIIVACVLYLIYVNVEGSLSYWSYGEDRLLVQAESQDAEADYAQD
ncbi:LEM domain-containing protein 1 isoform X2 [Oreochromis niloticus]|uniref:LEM domain-containing protein 1 isoform X2 n=1 Tax=Oreochromis niloticus TaxID=8128 RepID=UPI0003942945|nr:lamina-associated polypeptide 2, isoforms beta/gamma isoform X2 [Oreochromis niloticus]